MAHTELVTVNAAKVAASLTGFRHSVDLSQASAAFWAAVEEGGGSIRVHRQSDSQELARDVESCTKVDNSGILHFRDPGTLSSSIDTIYEISVDGTSPDYAHGATYGAGNVWLDADIVMRFQGDLINRVTNAPVPMRNGAANYSTTAKWGKQSFDLQGSVNSYALDLDALIPDFPTYSDAHLVFSTYGKTVGVDKGAPWEGLVGHTGFYDHFNYQNNYYSSVGRANRLIQGGGVSSDQIWNLITYNMSNNTASNFWQVFQNNTLFFDTTHGSSTLRFPASYGFRGLYLGIYSTQGFLLDWFIFEPISRSADWVETFWAMWDDPATFYTLSGGAGPGPQTLTGTLYSDADFFGSHTLTADQALAGTLYADADFFGSSTIAGVLAQDLTGSLYTDGDFFGSHIMAPGPVSLTGSVYNDADFFGEHTILGGNDLAGTLYADPDFFGSHLIANDQDLTGTLYSDPDFFGSHQLAYPQNLNGTLYSDPDWFGMNAATQPGEGAEIVGKRSIKNLKEWMSLPK